MKVNIRNIRLTDLERVKDFTDKWIGMNYFTKAELRKALIQGTNEELNASFLAMDEAENIVAIRITYLPGEWQENEDLKGYISPHKWKTPLSRTAYFKSLFVHKDYQKQGLGRELSTRSLHALYQAGALAVVCHAWVESPNNSSIQYLNSFKFESIKTHKDFWFFKDYECPRCHPNKCVCSAEEMIYYLPILDEEEEDDEEVIQGAKA